MAGPFDNQGGDDGGLEKFERAIQGDLDEPTSFDIGADDDPESEPEPQRQSRGDKKRDRPAMLDALRQTQDENKELKGRLERLEAERASDRSLLEQAVRRDQPDPVQQERDALRQEEEDLQDGWGRAVNSYARAQQEMPEAERLEWKNKRRALENKRDDFVARRAAAATQQRTPSQATEAILRADYPDVFANERAARYAVGEYQKLLAMGSPDTIETSRRALAAARRDIVKSSGGRESNEADDESERRRRTGVPRGSTGGGRGNGKTVSWNRDLQRLADAAYSDEPDPKKRAQRWVNDNGKDYLAALEKGA